LNLDPSDPMSSTRNARRHKDQAYFMAFNLS
jgi:hypothetical protein